MIRLAIYGSAAAGGAGQIIEALREQHDIKPEYILDSDAAMHGKQVFGVPVTGSTMELKSRWEQKEFDGLVIAIGGNLAERKKVFLQAIEWGIPLTNIFDSTVRFGLNVKTGTGNVILNNSYIGNNVSLGDNNYILNQCSIQHDSSIGSHNYLATNVTIGAKVTVGSLNRMSIKTIVESRSVIEDEQSFETGKIVYYKS